MVLNGDFPENRGLKWYSTDVALVASFELLLLVSIFGLVLLSLADWLILEGVGPLPVFFLWCNDRKGG